MDKKTKKFRKGTWLLCKWNKQCGDYIDIIQYKKSYKSQEGDVFRWSQFYRIQKNGKVDDLSNEDDESFPFKDERLAIQPRPLTAKEKVKYIRLIRRSIKQSTVKSYFDTEITITRKKMMELLIKATWWERELTDFERTKITMNEAREAKCKQIISEIE